MGEFLALAAVVVFLWASVGIIKPAWARLPNRWVAVAVFVASLLMLGIGGSMLPDSATDDHRGAYASFPTTAELTLDDWLVATPEQRAAAADEFVSVLRARTGSTRQLDDEVQMQACLDGEAEKLSDSSSPSRVPLPEFAMSCAGSLEVAWPR